MVTCELQFFDVIRVSLGGNFNINITIRQIIAETNDQTVGGQVEQLTRDKRRGCRSRDRWG